MKTRRIKDLPSKFRRRNRKLPNGSFTDLLGADRFRKVHIQAEYKPLFSAVSPLITQTVLHRYILRSPIIKPRHRDMHIYFRISAHIAKWDARTQFMFYTYDSDLNSVRDFCEICRWIRPLCDRLF